MYTELKLPRLCLALILLTSTSIAQSLVGVSWAGDVYRIDLASGRFTSVGTATTGDLRLNSMAELSDGRLIAGQVDISNLSVVSPVGSADLVAIDPFTAAVVPLGITLPFDIRALAVSPVGELFAVGRRAIGSSVGPAELYSIDLSSGSSTLRGGIGFDAQGLAFLGTQLFGMDVREGLLRIDPISGVGTDVNLAVGRPIPFSPFPQFLTVDSRGRLLTGRRNVVLLNPLTGTGVRLTDSAAAGLYLDLRGVEALGEGVGYGSGCSAVGLPPARLEVASFSFASRDLDLRMYADRTLSLPFFGVGLADESLPLAGFGPTCLVLVDRPLFFAGSTGLPTGSCLTLSAPATLTGMTLRVQGVNLEFSSGSVDLSNGVRFRVP